MPYDMVKERGIISFIWCSICWGMPYYSIKDWAIITRN